MSYCKLLKHGIVIEPNGSIVPCCVMDRTDYPYYTYDDDWKSVHLDMYESSKHQWLPRCAGCQKSEKTHGNSLRLYANEKLKNVDESDDIVYWDLKINNTCNLACRMCNAMSSSTWDQITKMSEAAGLGDHYIDYSTKSKWHREVNTFMPKVDGAQVVKFTGGEPMMIPQVEKIIDYLVDNELSHNIELSMTTNGTWDMSKYYERFSKFKHVTIIVSVDGIGPLFNYIRQNADWDQVYQNILRIKTNIQEFGDVHCEFTPQALNHHLEDEIKAFFAEQDIYVIVNNPVYSPEWMRPGALDDTVLRAKFIEQMTILDKIHGTDYRDIMP